MVGLRFLLVTTACMAFGALTASAHAQGSWEMKAPVPAALNEVNANAAPSVGVLGFVPPSLLSIHAFPQTFFHNGAALSLDEVMNNVTHRSAGTGGVDTLSNAADRAKVVRFLLSIDASTVPFP